MRKRGLDEFAREIDGLQSEMAAQFAGNQALSEFLAELSKEEKRPRK
jgi:hypothetical protein